MFNSISYSAEISCDFLLADLVAVLPAHRRRCVFCCFKRTSKLLFILNRERIRLIVAVCSVSFNMLRRFITDASRIPPDFSCIG